MGSKRKATVKDEAKVEATAEEGKCEGAVEEKIAESEEIKGEAPNRLKRSGYEIFMAQINRLKKLLYCLDDDIPVDNDAIMIALENVIDQARGRRFEDFDVGENEVLGLAVLDCSYWIARYTNDESLGEVLSEFISNHLEHSKIIKFLSHEEKGWQMIPCTCGRGYLIARGEMARKLQKKYDLHNQAIGVVRRDTKSRGDKILIEMIEKIIETVDNIRKFPGVKAGSGLLIELTGDLLDQLKIRTGEMIGDANLPFQIIDVFCFGAEIPEDALNWLSYYLTKNELVTYLVEHHPSFEIKDCENSIGCVVRNQFLLGQGVDSLKEYLLYMLINTELGDQ
jgi:hypothetical protein